MKRLVLTLTLALLLLPACVAKTQFLGQSHVPGGAQGCAAVCSNLGMEMAGMVVMGEYTDGCICAVPGTEPPAKRELVYTGATGAAGGVVGVRNQMDDDEEEQNNQNDQNNQD